MLVFPSCSTIYGNYCRHRPIVYRHAGNALITQGAVDGVRQGRIEINFQANQNLAQHLRIENEGVDLADI